ncbi:MAG: nitroreductase [Chloroflexi bacterium]|nr:nitroreductase [Chloroflexota bacterium]
MDVLEAIRTRRTVGKMRQDVPPRALIEEIIEAATWAPNHRLNEPWQFHVVAGEARRRFGEIMAADACEANGELSPEKAQGLIDSQMKKALRSPVVIAVSCDPPSGPKIDPVEDVCAVACGIQNLLLAAHARGLATKWSSGQPCYSASLKRFFGLTPEHQILGYIYLGYPDEETKPAARTSHHEKTSWMGWPTEG